jgi:integral membrane protein (TIGR01906 family)
MNLVRPILRWLVTISIPFFLIMTSVRLLITPLYPVWEYRTPNFPPDTYGFSLADRLKWSRISIDYLTNNAGPEFLADQRLPDGSSLYNERELSHMNDVKALVQKMILAWWILLAAIIAIGLLAWRTLWLSEFFQAVSRGGWSTVALVILILVGVFISFQSLFTDFHRIFFSGDTWIFLYSDTLIRLFPLQFWQDGFIWMGAFTITGALLCGFLGHWLSTK